MVFSTSACPPFSMCRMYSVEIGTHVRVHIYTSNVGEQKKKEKEISSPISNPHRQDREINTTSHVMRPSVISWNEEEMK